MATRSAPVSVLTVLWIYTPLTPKVTNEISISVFRKCASHFVVGTKNLVKIRRLVCLIFTKSMRGEIPPLPGRAGDLKILRSCRSWIFKVCLVLRSWGSWILRILEPNFLFHREILDLGDPGSWILRSWIPIFYQFIGILDILDPKSLFCCEILEILDPD